MKYELGGRIRAYRKARGLTQRQLAESLGVAKNRVSNWEQGLNRPDADILAGICRALRVSPSDLLDVHLAGEVLSEKERRLVEAYREKAEMRSAVDILLGIGGGTDTAADNAAKRRPQGSG